MIVEQIVDIPADRRITLDVPREVPAGRTILTFKPAEDHRSEIDREVEEAGEDWFEKGEPCPICAKHRDPETGEELFNDETIAAIEEGRAMMRGEIPSKRYNSLDEFFADLESDDWTMLEPKFTGPFKKERKLIVCEGYEVPWDKYLTKTTTPSGLLMEKRRKDMQKLREVMTLLITEQPLLSRHENHPLHGKWKGCLECHVEPNWLLIYEIDPVAREVTFHRTGSHADLYKN